jgi:hypothetical protein
MKEHPILFTGPMVKAILDGSKTQTRRIIKGLIKPDDPPCNIRTFDGDFQQYGAGGVWLRLGCPYGQPGDRLWVRETWSPMWSTDCNNCDGDPEFLDENGHCEHFYVEYRADTGHSRPGDWPDPEPNGDYADAPAWKPSIHMFRWASRITLEVTDVRVERVQDISGVDSSAEGIVIPVTPDGHPLYELAAGLDAYECERRPRDWMADDWRRAYFCKLWDSINAKRGYGWDVNPWVWVVGFKVIESKGGVT